MSHEYADFFDKMFDEGKLKMADTRQAFKVETTGEQNDSIQQAIKIQSMMLPSTGESLTKEDVAEYVIKKQQNKLDNILAKERAATFVQLQNFKAGRHQRVRSNALMACKPVVKGEREEEFQRLMS